jgi:hypothetical protein
MKNLHGKKGEANQRRAEPNPPRADSVLPSFTSVHRAPRFCSDRVRARGPRGSPPDMGGRGARTDADLRPSNGNATPKDKLPIKDSLVFAPFSDSRPYVLHGGKPPSSSSASLRRPQPPFPLPPPPILLAGEPGAPLLPSPRIGIYPVPPSTPRTARILESTYAARVNPTREGAISSAIAFSNAASNVGSPRIVVLSPRKPLSAQLPYALHALARSPRSIRTTFGGERSPQAAEAYGESSLLERGIHAKELSLFSGNQDWLFYPQREYEAKRVGSPPGHTSTMVTALPSMHSPESAATAPGSPDQVEEELLPASLDIDLDEDEKDEQSRCSNASPSAVRFAAGTSFSHVKPDGLVGFSQLSSRKEQRTVRESFTRRIAPAHVEAHFRKIQWFKDLPGDELQTLIKRCNHRNAPRWSTIIREGSIGSIFYVLLKGSVRVTSSSGLDIVLGEGVSFGEGALVTMVRREATVTAIEPCHLVQLTSKACEGLSVELHELKAHICSQILMKVSRRA